MTDPLNLPPGSGTRPVNLENDLLKEFLWENLKEKKRARRWNIAFKIFIGAYLLFILFAYFDADVPTSNGEHTALVEIDGVIAANGDVDADDVAAGLRAAFKADGVKGVIVRINSPGGSPVQAGSINSEIRRLREEHPDIPLHAVITDICASGGYYIAVAAEKIYADKASIVGSIGVLMDGFGFVDAMKKLGVERRLMTAGEYKGLLDPFSPLDDKSREHTGEILDEVHQQFIDIVKQGRSDRLGNDPDLFSGLFWTGERARELGLVDEFGSAGFVARSVFEAEKIVDYTYQESLLDRLAKQIGVGAVQALRLSSVPGLPELK